jgi:hypothetical protein
VNKRTTLPALLVLIATMSLLTAFSQAQTPHAPLTNPDVIRMVKDKLPESAIIGKIQSGPVKFDLSPGGLALLRQGNVSPNILRVMMSAEKAGTTPTPAGGAKPTTGTVPGHSPAGQPAAAGTAPGRAPGRTQAAMPVAAKIKITAGPRIKIAGLAPSTLTSSTAQILHEQATQARLERGVGSPAGRKIMASGTPAGGDPAGGSTPGRNPTGGATPSGNPPGGGTGPAPTTAGPTSLSQKLVHAPQTMSQCKFSSNPVIETVSGKNRGIIFTPEIGTGPNPTNQYTIKGCNFGQGQGQGQVHLFGPFINHSSPVRLGIDSWSDNLIVVTFDPTFQDEYDLKNITLVVVASNGQNVQLPGQSFVAARGSRPLTRVPQSLVTLPTTSLQQDTFVSPVTPATLSAAKLGPFPQAVTLAFYQGAPLWDSPNTSDGYPQSRISWSEFVDMSKLRPGFVLDSDIQTYTTFAGDLSSHDIGVGGGSCKYYDTPLSAAMQNNKLAIGVQPAECDNYGKYIVAYYGLALSVIGPKGSKLNPWLDNL